MFKKISHLERLLFTKHLATMVKAGITLTEALETLQQQVKSLTFKKVLENILKDVNNGQDLAKTMSKHKAVFDDFYISMVEIGERSGKLENNLEFLARQLAKDYNTRKKVQGAMLYPGLVLTAAVVMGGFIGLFVLPKLVEFFAAFEIDLPVATRILLWVSILMRDWGVLIFGGLGVLGVLGYLGVRLPKVKPYWHGFLLKIPLFGQILVYGQLARFSRNLGTLLESGVPITRSLETTARTMSNLKFRLSLEKVTEELKKGKKVGVILQDKKYSLFPVLVARMISVGEKTGKLEEVLLYLSEFYEDEIDNISKNLTTILEPVLLITIGLVVGFVALAIISPIYELTGSIRR